MIPDSFKQDLLNRVDIVDVVSRYVQLKKGGANYLGLCPFHGEKTPSFTVSPAKQFYHCFGCAAHGNAIGFLMAYAGLGYVDAVKDLAAALGMQVPQVHAPGPEEAARKERETDLYAVMEKAMDFYRAELKKSPHAVEYLKRRGLTGEIAARFRIGYAPDDWQGLKAVFAEYEDKALVECGLVIENEGKRYDRFRDRVMFPILSARGAVIGFGGRVIADGEPKYLNSPETPLFEKGREVYGLVQARDSIRSAGRVVVVEGYMDVVALAQFDIGYAVATLGTATTPVHVSKLLKLADELVFCFVGDAAGGGDGALADRRYGQFQEILRRHILAIDPDGEVVGGRQLRVVHIGGQCDRRTAGPAPDHLGRQPRPSLRVMRTSRLPRSLVDEAPEAAHILSQLAEDHVRPIAGEV